MSELEAALILKAMSSIGTTNANCSSSPLRNKAVGGVRRNSHLLTNNRNDFRRTHSNHLDANQDMPIPKIPIGGTQTNINMVLPTSVPIQHDSQFSSRRVFVLCCQSDDAADENMQVLSNQHNQHIISNRSVTPYSPVQEGSSRTFASVTGKRQMDQHIARTTTVMSPIPNILANKQHRSRVNVVEISPRTVFGSQRKSTSMRPALMIPQVHKNANTGIHRSTAKEGVQNHNEHILQGKKNTKESGVSYKPLPPPPPMLRFQNFQANDNMQSLSILSKKTSNPPVSSSSATTSLPATENVVRSLPNLSSSQKQQLSRMITKNNSLKRKLEIMNNSLHDALEAKRNKSNRSITTDQHDITFQGLTYIQQIQLYQLNLQQQLHLLKRQEQKLQLFNNNSSVSGECYEVGDTNVTNFQNKLYKSRPSHSPEDRCLTPSSLLNDTTNTKSKTKIKMCKMEGCSVEADKRSPYCKNHRGQRKCEHSDCNKFAQSKTRFCIKHGGGRRCTFAGCTKGARDKFFCGAHGGGRRCTHPKCKKLAVGGGDLCTAHGGGKRCKEVSCSKSAQSSSDFCVRHGGGRKCKIDECEKVARGKLGLCMAHINS